MENRDWESMEKEMERLENLSQSRKEKELDNITKYFDRIHDNLSSYNNVLIGGYFALTQLK